MGGDIGPELTRGRQQGEAGVAAGLAAESARLRSGNGDAALSLQRCAGRDALRISAGENGFRSARQRASRCGNAGADRARQAPGFRLRLRFVPRNCGHQEAGELRAGTQPHRQQADHATDFPAGNAAHVARLHCGQDQAAARLLAGAEDAAVHLHAGADRFADHGAALVERSLVTRCRRRLRWRRRRSRITSRPAKPES